MVSCPSDKLSKSWLVDPSECVVTLRDHSCTTSTHVNHGNLTKVVSLIQSTDEFLLTELITNSDLACSLTDKVHGNIKFVLLELVLLDDFLVRNIGESTKLVNKTWQECTVSFVDVICLVLAHQTCEHVATLESPLFILFALVQDSSLGLINDLVFIEHFMEHMTLHSERETGRYLLEERVELILLRHGRDNSLEIFSNHTTQLL